MDVKLYYVKVSVGLFLVKCARCENVIHSASEMRYLPRISSCSKCKDVKLYKISHYR